MDKKRTKRGHLRQGEKVPYDFWNYGINPILGYRYEPRLKFKR